MTHRTTLAAAAAVTILATATPSSAIIREVPGQYDTIQTALDDANEGDIVLVAPGTYTENLTIPRAVYLISEEPGGAVIDADGGDAIVANHVQMLQVIGFAIHNCRAAVIATESTGAVVDVSVSGCLPENGYEDAISFNGGADATIARVDMSANESFDITVGLIGTYVEGEALIQDVTVSSSDALGFQVHADSAAILDCTLDGLGGDAIISGAERALIARNVIADPTESAISLTDGSSILVRDNELTGAGQFGIQMYTEGGRIAEATVWDTIISGAYQTGIVVVDDVGELTIGHCSILDGDANGIRLEDSDIVATIHDTLVAGNADYGITIGTLGEGFLDSSDVTIRRNVLAENLEGLHIQDSDALVINNTVVDNWDYGIWHTTSADEPTYVPTFMNNIIMGHGELGLCNDYTTCDISYSLSFDNDDPFGECEPEDPPLDLYCEGTLGMVYEDPLFTDYAGGDYTLAAGSPARDAGNPEPTYNDDDGTVNDMGAYGGPSEPDLPENQPPSFTFEEFDSVPEGQCQTVRIPEGADPEGEPLFIEWTITGGTNGTWTAYGTTVRICGEDDGEYSWTATVTDPYGESATAGEDITVTNIAPGITSTMPTTANVGVDYLYQIEIFDPGYFDTFEYILDEDSLQAGMSIDEFGVLSWTPTADQEGDHTVRITVRDDDGGESNQIDTIHVRGTDAGGDDDDCSCRQDPRPHGRGLALLLPLVGLLALRRVRR